MGYKPLSKTKGNIFFLVQKKLKSDAVPYNSTIMQFLPFVYAGVPMSFPPPCYFVPVQFPAVFPPFFMPPMAQPMVQPLVQPLAQPLAQPMVQHPLVQTFRAHMPFPIIRLALPKALTALEQAQQTAEKCAMWVLE